MESGGGRARDIPNPNHAPEWVISRESHTMMMMMTMAGKVAIEWQTSRPMGGRIAVFSQAPPQELRSWSETGNLPVTLALREHGDFSHFNDGSLLPAPISSLAASSTLPNPTQRTLCIQKPTCSCYGELARPTLIFFSSPRGAGAAKSTLALRTPSW
ncbi:hypothetical protein AVEN_42686-1 [Araneus ventricosus]|uniref:Uncharacterized protein n=1 Tax=Araneus ventricosus TaxID=182803 RepID=A0A4Y2BNR4_ARAVE|nr:hypothetical protein AVEN_42686-1 [Araneus ventricosus]